MAEEGKEDRQTLSLLLFLRGAFPTCFCGRHVGAKFGTESDPDNLEKE